MALIACPECQSEISDKAVACPKCGNPMASPTAPSVTSTPAEGPGKSRIVYVLLGLLFGIFGIHNFYAGRGATGFFQLLVTVGLGLLIAPIVALTVVIWVIIEICTVTADGSGRPLN